MFDTAMARRMMVDGQVRTADVTNLDLIAAMLAIPREIFAPPGLADQAYLDSDIALGGGRVLLKPMILRQTHSGGKGRSERPRTRCRLWHRLFLCSAVADHRFGGGA